MKDTCRNYCKLNDSEMKLWEVARKDVDYEKKKNRLANGIKKICHRSNQKE